MLSLKLTFLLSFFTFIRRLFSSPSLSDIKGGAMCICCCSVAQSCPTLCDPMDCSPPGSSVHEDSPGKNTGVGCHFLLQGIFPTQGSNPGLLHCRQILYHLSHQGSPVCRVHHEKCWLAEAQAVIKIARRNINNFR